MTVFLHELRLNRISLLIWSGVISFMLGVCIIIYPEMTSQMGEISEMFSEMGAFSSAFGMDKLNFGEFIGYFGIECGNVLGIGGALFAAIVGAGALIKEEREHTAEFLLTHPISRARIITEKLAACFTQILILNLCVVAVSVVCIFAVDVKTDTLPIVLLFLSNFILQIEICAVSFGLSAFLRRGELGVGLGFVFSMYFFNIASNLMEKLGFLKYITPFAYCEGSYIVSQRTLELKYLAVGAAITVVGIVAAYWKYTKKDIT